MKLLHWSYDQSNFSLIYVTNSLSRMKLVLLFLSFLIINEILAKKSGGHHHKTFNRRFLKDQEHSNPFVAYMQNHLKTEDGDWAKLIRWIFFKSNYPFYRIAITKFTLFRECDKLRKLVVKNDPGTKYRRLYGVSILFDLENLLTKGKVI